MVNFIDVVSMGFLLSASVLFTYILLKFYRGIKRPPFWIYIYAGYLLITLHGILISVPLEFDETIVSIVRLIGNLLMLIGVISLFRSFRSRIAFDKTS